jgi:hypothetical protein
MTALQAELPALDDARLRFVQTVERISSTAKPSATCSSPTRGV